MAQAKRLDWVDTAKGISIILVVMLYAANSVGEATGGTGFLHYVIGFATPFRMPEFFLISGLFLSAVIGRDWARFVDRRVVHYLYFYGLWAFILIVVKVAILSGEPGRALSWLGWAVIDPYSMLWFIYVLAFFSLTAKIAHAMKIPHWAMLAFAAALQIAPVDGPGYAIDYYAEYLVYFYSGYVFAPQIFKLVDWFISKPLLIVGALAVWAVLNGTLVFLPEFKAMPDHFEMGYAALPGLHLALALVGALAVCITASLFSRFDAMNWLRYMGQNSIVIYLAFSLPMAISREILLRLGLITETGPLSAVVLLIALVSPLVLFWMVKKTGWGTFLFTRPAWAHIPGTPGSLSEQEKTKAHPVPAE